MTTTSSVLVLLLAVSLVSGTSSIQWKWISGKSTTDNKGICGQAGTFAKTNAPGARHDASMIAISGYIYVFGGAGLSTNNQEGTLGDIWSYRAALSEGEWAWLGGKSSGIDYYGDYSGSTSYPGARSDGVLWSETSQLIYVFGGLGYSSSESGALCDLWTFNINTFTWTWINGPSIEDSKADYDEDEMPGAVYGHVLLKNGFVFAGSGFDENDEGMLADVWHYSNDEWTWLNGPKSVDKSSIGGSSGVFSVTYYPGGRYDSSAMDVGPAGDYVYLYGGLGRSSDETEDGTLADLWVYSVSGNQWAYVHGPSNRINVDPQYGLPVHPGSRFSHVGWKDPNSGLLCIFGGMKLMVSDHLNDFWVFNATNKVWRWVGGDSGVNNKGDYLSNGRPGGREGGAGAVSVDLGVMLLFGGSGYVPKEVSPGSLNDLWITKGLVIPTSTPIPIPSPTETPTSRYTVEPTSTPSTPNVTATPVQTSIPTPVIVTPTATIANFTVTPVPVPTDELTPRITVAPSVNFTATPVLMTPTAANFTAIPVPTPTYTPVIPTYTPVIPTYTPVIPTYTPVIPTYTPVIPTSITPTDKPTKPTLTPATPTATCPCTSTTKLRPIVSSTPSPTSVPAPRNTTLVFSVSVVVSVSVLALLCVWLRSRRDSARREVERVPLTDLEFGFNDTSARRRQMYLPVRESDE